MEERPYFQDTTAWAGLKGCRLFLTGGTGFFGKWLLRFFVETAEELGIEVTVLSRDPDAFIGECPQWALAPNISLVKGDVRSFAFPDGRFEYVIHAAAPIGSGGLSYDSPEMYSIVVEGMERVLQFAENAGALRLLNVSSGGVYGAQPPEVLQIPETADCSPSNAYGKGKVCSEQKCFAGDTEVVVARCFAFIGEYLPLDNRFAIGNFIQDCLLDRTVEIRGDGTPLRSYMHGADLVNWLLTMLLRGKAGNVYNVGSDTAISIAETAELVRRVVGSENSIHIHQQAAPGQCPDRYVPSIRKATGELGLSLDIDLEDAVRATSEYWKNVKHGI